MITTLLCFAIDSFMFVFLLFGLCMPGKSLEETPWSRLALVFEEVYTQTIMEDFRSSKYLIIDILAAQSK